MENINKLFPKLADLVSQLDFENIPAERKAILQSLTQYIAQSVKNHGVVNLNFICTHNSRRSQLSQVWAAVAGFAFGIPVRSYSGGVEVTAFNERAVSSLERTGFKVTKDRDANPLYEVYYTEMHEPVRAFSKLYDDAENPQENFAAIMTCDHADENCPFIPGAEVRLPVRFEDPKAFDDTPLESAKYDERSLQIAQELFYAFKNASI